MPSVAFGTESIDFDVHPGDQLRVVEPADGHSAWEEDRFHHRLELEGLASFLRQTPVLTIVNDAFRPTPTGTVLCQLKKFYPDFSSDFIVACGNHPPPSPGDMAAIFAPYSIDRTSMIFVHDSRDYGRMAAAGSFRGHLVYISKCLFEYKALLVIGSVEPHYFAGFTGGRKAIIPGLSDLETNRRNHALAVSIEARPMRLEGNPVAENLEALLRQVTLPPLFSIQIVAGKVQPIVDAFAGDLETSFRQACRLAEQVYSFPVDRTFDLVIAEMRPPLDRNLYQLQKGIENCAAAVADGGTLLAVSRCAEGVGNDEFLRLADRLGSAEKILEEAALECPAMGIHKLSRMIRLGERIAVRAITSLGDDVLKKVFIEPAASIAAELHRLRKGKKYLNVLLVRDAGQRAAKWEKIIEENRRHS